MKTPGMIIAALLCFSSSVFAQEMQSIDSVKSVELRGNALNAIYEIGGGCAEHEGYVRVTLEKTQAAKSYVAKVNVYDIAAEVDVCEAKLSISVAADMNQLIKQAAARQNIAVEELERVQILLPAQSFSDFQ